MSEILDKKESDDVMGACFEVYKDKGAGFVEPICHDCLELEYKGRPLKRKYEADFVAYSRILLEVKAVKALVDELRAQVINYLKATGLQLGLLVNFGKIGGLEWERIILADWLRENSKPPNLQS